MSRPTPVESICTKCAEAQQALRESSFHNLRGLAVDQLENSLVISGRVTSFYQKQMAQEIVRAICSGIPLQNQVDVSEPL